MPHINLPNKLTMSRLILAIIFFVFLSYRFFDIALVAFLFAGLTDWFDGYLARKRGLLTEFGRIADPFVDKIIICGGFITLILHAQTVLAPWMVVVIVAREFLINSLRSYSEMKNIPTPSNMWGKSKMFLQTVTIGALLLFFGHFQTNPWAWTVVTILLWATISLTVVSGLHYIIKARQTLLTALST
ncbi:MAG TPA: CDP-diacylglycerol--glycerol-3-phosphate 3-phosphatidyltransferase [Candidatus Brocadiia bacterium]|nr:CDP-diacylglycerol--glycerol-3-phosphate 3-phosphatidyltransferase [Planctomycetota bacterium]MDO8092716.1 CDP-diacylglycerol--glycerol-3-phosphate 3-phosphatidyltransferase [Candidatus Brocadiales bacterium]